MKKSLKKKKGFTLIELIIVIAILGILAAIAIPKFGSAQKDAKIKSDISTAKTISDTTAMLVAKGDINLPTADDTVITKVSDIAKELQGETDTLPKPQFEKTKFFTVTLDTSGNVKVYITAAANTLTDAEKKSNEIYPNSGSYK